MRNIKILALAVSLSLVTSCKDAVQRPDLAPNNDSGNVDRGDSVDPSTENRVSPISGSSPIAAQPPGTSQAASTQPTAVQPVPYAPPTVTVDDKHFLVDYAAFPVNFEHLMWMSPVVRTSAGEGFNFKIGTASGNRTDMNNVSWPDSAYYQTITGSFSTVASWDMRVFILYNTVAAGDWKKSGWQHYQDMAEGSTCVDDTARGAIAIIDQYLATGDENSYKYARSLLNFLGYMVTNQGNVYNFAWLDASKHFTSNDIQKQDKHYLARFDTNKRWRYPDSRDAGNPQGDPDGLIIRPTSTSAISAPPYRSHPKYSIFMNDLRDAVGHDVATVYDVPLFDRITGEPSGLKTGVKTVISTSHQGYNAWSARNLWAFAKAFSLIQKRAAVTKTLSAEDTVLAKFIENHFNRMLHFALTQSNLGSLDVKQNSVMIAALSEYLRAIQTSKEFPAYTFQLPVDGGTPNTVDDRVNPDTINSVLSSMVSHLIASQYHSDDWRNGIYVDNANDGHWSAWGELEIYALSTYAQYRFEAGDKTAATTALASATLAADGFFNQAYHYKSSANEYAGSRDRITAVTNWNARYHNTPGYPQLEFGQSNITAGLWRLAQAYEVSGRTDAVTKRNEYLQNMLTVGSWYLGNNTAMTPMYNGRKGSSPYEGNGAFLDAIDGHTDGTYSVNPSSGGEANAEGMRAMVLIQSAIKKYGLQSWLLIRK
ncbi:MAG: hypothetical protein H7249_09045 [Chitinophagaceae bacterium]|nr:hypothetical protein [Oligoflexus sp.]